MVRGRSPLQPDTLPLKAGLDEDEGTGERDPRATSGNEGQQASGLWRQRPRETEFVTIGIGQVEVALAPLSIARGRSWREPGGTRRLVRLDARQLYDGAWPRTALALVDLGRAPEKPFAATELRRASLRVNVYQAVRSDAFALTYDEYWTGFEALFAQTDVIAIGEPLVPQHSDYDFGGLLESGGWVWDRRGPFWRGPARS